MDSFFKISQRSSSVATELVGGLTTFLAMAYILAVNPAMLAAAGVPLSAALTATCLGAALVTLLMGLVANRPIALASGMGRTKKESESAAAKSALEMLGFTKEDKTSKEDRERLKRERAAEKAQAKQEKKQLKAARSKE